MQGFKTFALRTTLELRPGITAVVGPNGSGKSNIADAVRWALGETNLRHVRCRSTDELIFAGNAKRSAVGFAEVSLVFENDGGWLSVPFSEVRVTRKAYRSGENEYLLNGTRVRLRDIIDLLAGASIHAGGHVVVNQGLVDSVLALRAEERRPIIENLAGLKQYYLRRDDAEGKLSATEANLVHVDAMIAEITPQLANLSAQAEALQAFKAAEAELRELQRATFGSQAARLVTRVDAARVAADTALDQLTSCREEATRLRGEDDALLTLLGEHRKTRESLRRRISEQQQLVANARRDRDVAAAQAQAADERAQFSRAEHARLTATAGAEHERLADAEAVSARARAAVATAVAALQDRRQHANGLASERDSALSAHRKAQAAQLEASKTVA
ncbi:MAG: smc, partial [Chloroflexi bacterium]|nr:smc [Chloroflexota bacterium]